MSLVAGSYERFIWGFKLKSTLSSHEPIPNPDSSLPHTLQSLFSYPAHRSPIKSVAISGPVAVSGGSDDTIKIFDLVSRSEIGNLTNHAGAVTCLGFYGLNQNAGSSNFPRNLLSGSEDGTICIFDADQFVHLKTMKAHKRGVNDLTIHCSGRLALSVGRDLHLGMFNLVNGRKSFSCRLQREASMVRYDWGCGKFFLGMEEMVSVHDSEDARLVHVMDHPKRVLCIAPSENGLLFTGGEDRNMRAWDIASGKVAFTIEDAHSARLKGLVFLGSRSKDETSASTYLVASASTDGVVRVWDLRMAKKEKPTPLTEANTKSRITCLAGSSIKCESFYFSGLFLGIFSTSHRGIQTVCIDESSPFTWCLHQS